MHSTQSPDELLEYYLRYEKSINTGLRDDDHKSLDWQKLPITRLLLDTVSRHDTGFLSRCGGLVLDESKLKEQRRNKNTDKIIKEQLQALSPKTKVAILNDKEMAGLCQELAPRYAAYFRAMKKGDKALLQILNDKWQRLDSKQSLDTLSSMMDANGEHAAQIHDLARGFNTVYADSATIHLSVSMSLAPFFRGDIETRLSELCDSTTWHNLVGFNDQGKGMLEQPDADYDRDISKFFSYDWREREADTKGANCEIFRGLAYHQYLMPYYALAVDASNKREASCNWEKLTEDYANIVSMADKGHGNRRLSNFLKELRAEIGSTTFDPTMPPILQLWECRIALTNDGLGVVNFTRRLTREEQLSVSDRRCAKELKWLTAPPCPKSDFMQYDTQPAISEQPISSHRRTMQLFNTRFNAAAVWVLHAFMKDRKIGETIANILRVEKYSEEELRRDPHKHILKHPWNVTYSSEESRLPGLPPVRNHFIAYLLEDIRGSAWSVDFVASLLDKSNSNTPKDSTEVSNHKLLPSCLITKKEFIKTFGNNFLALATGAYTDEHIGQSRVIPFFSKDILSDLPTKDLSILESSMCFLHEENTVIANPGGQIAVRGVDISHEDYWANLVKGFAFLSRCKTLAQVLSRTLLECSLREPGNSKVDAATQIQSKLSRISQLLNRCRTASTPAQLSGLTFAREKFQAFGRTIGLYEIIDSVSDEYRERDTAITTYLERHQTEEEIAQTRLIKDLTILICFLTAILTFNELAKLTEKLIATPLSTIGTVFTYIFIGITFTCIGFLIWFFRRFWNQSKPMGSSKSD